MNAVAHTAIWARCPINNVMMSISVANRLDAERHRHPLDHQGAQRHAEADQHRRHCGVPRHVQAAERWWAFRPPVPMWVPQSNTLANRKMPWFRARPRLTSRISCDRSRKRDERTLAEMKSRD